MNTAVVVYLLLEAAGLFVRIYAFVVLFRRPPWAWQEARRSRMLWLVLLGVSFLLPVVGLVLVLWFLFLVEPAVRRQERVGPRIGFPGGPGGP